MKLNPDDQFYPTKDTVREILKPYALKLATFEPAKSGIENITLIVDTDKGKFVLRVYRQNKKTDTAILEETKFTNFLAKNRLPVPGIITNQEHKYLSHTSIGNVSWQVIVMEYMPGVHAERYSLPLIQSMADTQARVHLLSESYDYDEQILRKLEELRETIIIKQIVRDKSLDDRLHSFLNRAESYVLSLPSILPAGICHMDYSKGNILVNSNDTVAAVLDFDDMEVAPYAVCLGFSLYHLLHGGSTKSEQEEYLRRYKAIRKLTKAEERILLDVALFRHYFISSLAIFHEHRTEEDIVRYLEIEEELTKRGNNSLLSIK
ncbi:MAG: phosphotransferase [Candidatus Saccharimonadales bacterium]